MRVAVAQNYLMNGNKLLMDRVSGVEGGILEVEGHLLPPPVPKLKQYVFCMEL